MGFFACYPETHENWTTDPHVAKQWEDEGFVLRHEPCRGGIDSWEHQRHCGCAGDGLWRKVDEECPFPDVNEEGVCNYCGNHH